MTILRLPQVKARTGLSKTTIYRLASAGRFPRRIQVTENIVGWLEADVEAFLRARVQASSDDYPEPSGPQL